MKNKPKISVIVTNYNNATYIEECLTSLKAQTFKDFEAIIVDDGSTDNSIEIINNIAAADSRLKLFKSQHVGFPLAKNIGLDNATGDYIIFLDADDSAYPYWLQMLYEIAIRSNSDITTCLYDKYKNKKAVEPPFKKIVDGFCVREYSWTKMLLLYHNSCLSYMWNKLIKHELYDGIRHVDQIALSDVSVMYKIFDKANKVTQIMLPLVHYRQHENSMTAITHKNPKDYYTFRINLFKDVLKFVYNKYPQARNICRVVMRQELSVAKAALGDDFTKLIIIDDIKDILYGPCARILL